MEVVASLSQGRTAAAQCGLFTHRSVPVIFEPPCIFQPNNFSVSNQRSDEPQCEVHSSVVRENGR